MSTSYDLQVGAIGAAITLSCTEDGVAVDLTDATTHEIILHGPRGPRLTKVGSIVGDAEDGVLMWITVAGDISQPGTWRAQAHLVFDDLTEFWSSTIEFTVGPNL